MAVVFSTGHVGFSQMPASDWGTASWCTLRGRPSPLLPHASTPSHRPSLAPREQGGPLAAVTANNSQQQPTKAGNKQNSLIYDYLLCFPVFPHTAQESVIWFFHFLTSPHSKPKGIFQLTCHAGRRTAIDSQHSTMDLREIHDWISMHEIPPPYQVHARFSTGWPLSLFFCRY